MRLPTRVLLAISLAALSAGAIAGRFLLPPRLEPLSAALLLLVAAVAYGLGLNQGKQRIAALTEVMARQLAEPAQASNAATLTAASPRHLYDCNPVPMYVYDQETLRFLDVNDSAIRHYGYSRERFQAMTIEDIRSPEEVARLRAYRGRAGMISADGSV